MPEQARGGGGLRRRRPPLRALTGKLVLAAVLPSMAVGSLSSCVLTNGPVPMKSGFRMEGDGIVVAHPVCAPESVSGAGIPVGVGGAGRGDGFKAPT
ncbi:hypothetical protein ACFU9B_06990 [Streptomyces sp. NPDC057592]|uniref:hypothetical protein n=1 Tax=Streptomyces sp. NPDC057592 TaxID=3346175 RepID=UPI0036AE2808